MFYSHEILTSETHGVATVWLVSTIGLRSTAKKISRKAIQEVNVKKACETILQPAAPIALRLQGSLLYGLSRVYSQQCHYVLTDAEKVQAHMRAFYRALGGSDNALDPQAGRSKRNELMIQDDPGFDLNPDLPIFHFDDDGNLVAPQCSQSSRKTSSHLSPHPGEGSLSSSIRSLIGGLDIPHSPFGSGNSLLGGQFWAGTMTPDKRNDELLGLVDEERELPAPDDLGFVIDSEGNIQPVMEEPQLPRLPQPQNQEGADIIPQDDFIPFDDQGDIIMGGVGNVFNSDPPGLLRQEQEEVPQGNQERGQEPEEPEVSRQDEVSSGQAPVRVRRQRRRPTLAPDDQTKITRQEIKSWSANYLDNAEQASRTRHGTTATEARRNAFNLVFGRGIASVGFPTGVPGLPHPLASHFAGEGLQAHLLGIIITRPDDAGIEGSRGRRRLAQEAFDDEQEEAERRVRRRLSEELDEDQHAQPQLPGDDYALPLLPGDDELPVEIGRRAESALPDIPSDVPWNRGSSQIPSSSVKGGGGSKPPSRHVSASPLHGRGNLSLIQGPDIERYSDTHPFLGSDDNLGGGFPAPHSGPLHSGGSIQSPPPLFGSNIYHNAQLPSQELRNALDREGRNFLTYVESVARDKGTFTFSHDDNDDDDTDSRRCWVEFAQLFEAADQTKAVVAQAFYHVLSLATKSVIRVRQEGQGGTEPFGVIRLGVEIRGDEVVSDDDDGLDVVGGEGVEGSGGEEMVLDEE